MLYPLPRLDAGAVVVLYLAHLGDKIGPFLQRRMCAAARDDELDGGRFQVREAEECGDGEETDPRRDRRLVEDDEAGMQLFIFVCPAPPVG